jgi:hypothetical protein
MYIGLHVKYLLFLSDFNKTWIFLTDLKKKTQIQNFMQIHPVGAQSFCVDREMDRQMCQS